MPINSRDIPYLLSLVFMISVSSAAWGSCEVVDTGGKTSPFEGKNLVGLQVEKQSLIILNKSYPELKVLEKTFKGEVQTCASCADKFVRCTKD